MIGLRPEINADRPLAGLKVAQIHPAWHSCGSYRSFVTQAEAYRALGAAVSSIAIADLPGFAPGRRWLWRRYLDATPEFSGSDRLFGGAPLRALFAPRFLRDALLPYLHGDIAAMRVAVAERARLPESVEREQFDLVHCNHFFLMPVACRLARGEAPIILDTHDVQARQFELINRSSPYLLRPRASFESMLERELAQMSRASLCAHVNDDELAFFEARLPEGAHALLYPSTPPPPMGEGGPDIILVASNNAANVESVIWFLREVAPRAPGVEVRIVGGVDAGVRARAPEVFDAYRSWFTGRVDDPGVFYGSARLALLPTISGTGLSIKTVEALASGLPLIATTRAFRGMDAIALTLEGVAVADSPEDFARALRERAARSATGAAERLESATRRYYEERFSLAAYQRKLATAALPLLSKID
jgi:glycosyltransferase involved in cell wall biosynthesis